MKHSGKLHRLHGADDETMEQLYSQMPPDWDMDAVFERSYHKYLAQSAADPDVPPAEEPITVTEHRVRRPYLSALVTAACMILCFATVGTILYTQRSMLTMQPVPEETSASETAAVTEATAETPTQDVTLPAVAMTDAAETQASEPATGETDWEHVVSHTASETAEPSNDAKPVQTEAQAPDPTEPPAQNQTDPPKQNATDPPTETQPAPTENGGDVTPPPGEGDAPVTGEPTLLEDDAPADSVFGITRSSDRITFTGAGPDLPFVEGTPAVDTGRFTFEQFAESDPYTKHYTVTDQDSGSTFTLHLFRYNGFSMMNFTDRDINGGFTREWINGREGFLGEGNLFWDHDGGIALLTFVPADTDTARQIAAHLIFE